MRPAKLPERVATLGGGNMAEAILRGLIDAGLAPDALLAADPIAERREQLHSTLGVRTTAENAETVAFADFVLLAVKPDQLEAATRPLPGDTDALFLSILAGTSLETLRDRLGPRARVLRSMPNTPALVRSGVSALAPDGARAEDLAQAEAVLSAVGSVVRVPEVALDAVTGLSGSGPAYVYRFVESLVEAGVREGLEPDVARVLAHETVLGAARMLQLTGEEPAVLRQRVSSRGGTTLAGLAALEAAGFHASVLEAVRAATARSRELGQAGRRAAPPPA